LLSYVNLKSADSKNNNQLKLIQFIHLKLYMPIDGFPIDAGVAIINKKQQASCPRGSFGWLNYLSL